MTALAEVENLKKTPLYDEHVRLGGKMAGFGGWALPIYYSSILSEHQAVRENCGFFDVSHLGEIRVTGKGAFDFLQQRLTNDLSRLEPGRMQYHLLLNEDGGILDDVLVCCESREDYYVIVNAATSDSDFAVLQASSPQGLSLTNASEFMACVAVQGPKAEEVLERIFGFSLKSLAYYAFKEESFAGKPVWVTRSGYTGEDGFELFSENALVPALWNKLVSDGKPLGAVPAGLGARNTLRLEAGNLLYGSDMDASTTPLEAGLTFAVAMEKGGFTGREALVRQKAESLGRKLVAFKMIDKSIARDHYPIFQGEKNVGMVTSGSFGPTCAANIGLAYVSSALTAPGTQLEIEIHGRRARAEVVKRPFVPTRHKK